MPRRQPRFTISPAVLEDAAEIGQLVSQSIVALCHNDHRGDSALIDRWLADKTAANVGEWLGLNQTCVATLAAGEIIGVAMVSPDGEILLNYVSPDHVGYGIGGAMLKWLEAITADLSTLRVSSTRSARGFYLQHGFSCREGAELELEKRLTDGPRRQDDEQR